MAQNVRQDLPPAKDAMEEVVKDFIRLTLDAIVVADMRENDTPLIWVNEQFQTITGYSPEEVIGKNCRYLQGIDRLQPEIALIREAIRCQTAATVTIRNYRKDGSPFWNELSLMPRPGSDGTNRYFVGRIRDVSASKEGFDQAIHDAKHDRLSGLPNRYSFLDNIESIEIPENKNLIIVKIDIAGIHNINSTYGYSTGDNIICIMASRLLSLKADAVSRIGNNEFSIAFIIDLNDIDKIMEIIHCKLKPPFAVTDAIINISYALGYSVGNQGQSPTLLTQQAGHALHVSKVDSRRTPCRFDESLLQTSRYRLKLASELKQAISNNDFIYHYQPQYDLHTREIIGVEALIRWQHPVFGLQSPDMFIGIAEETGIIIDIERKGIRQVAAFAAKVNRNRTNPVNFSVNVSALEFTCPDFEYFLHDLVNTTPLDPSYITLEITESLLTDSSDEIVSLFRRIRNLGFGLSIDDFGTGYSNLRSISKFPVSEIKIDRIFTNDLNDSSIKSIMISSILSIGRALNAKVVAEGIENSDQENDLINMGCTIGQGYLFSRPINSELFQKLIGNIT